MGEFSSLVVFLEVNFQKFLKKGQNVTISVTIYRLRVLIKLKKKQRSTTTHYTTQRAKI